MHLFHLPFLFYMTRVLKIFKGNGLRDENQLTFVNIRIIHFRLLSFTSCCRLVLITTRLERFQFKETCDFQLENANVATGFLFNLWCCGFIIRTAGCNSKFTLFDQKPAFIFQNLQFGKPWRGNCFFLTKIK